MGVNLYLAKKERRVLRGINVACVKREENNLLIIFFYIVT